MVEPLYLWDKLHVPGVCSWILQCAYAMMQKWSSWLDASLVEVFIPIQFWEVLVGWFVCLWFFFLVWLCVFGWLVCLGFVFTCCLAGFLHLKGNVFLLVKIAEWNRIREARTKCVFCIHLLLGRIEIKPKAHAEEILGNGQMNKKYVNMHSAGWREHSLELQKLIWGGIGEKKRVQIYWTIKGRNRSVETARQVWQLEEGKMKSHKTKVGRSDWCCQDWATAGKNASMNREDICCRG